MLGYTHNQEQGYSSDAYQLTIDGVPISETAGSIEMIRSKTLLVSISDDQLSHRVMMLRFSDIPNEFSIVVLTLHPIKISDSIYCDTIQILQVNKRFCVILYSEIDPMTWKNPWSILDFRKELVSIIKARNSLDQTINIEGQDETFKVSCPIDNPKRAFGYSSPS